MHPEIERILLTSRPVPRIGMRCYVCNTSLIGCVICARRPEERAMRKDLAALVAVIDLPAIFFLTDIIVG